MTLTVDKHPTESALLSSGNSKRPRGQETVKSQAAPDKEAMHRHSSRDDPLAHECVKGREYGQHTARSYCDQATAKLVGQCGLMTDELDD